MKQSKRIETYWICEDCADKRGWSFPKGYVGTVISGLCGHCNRKDEATLIPTRDFVKSKKETK